VTELLEVKIDVASAVAFLQFGAKRLDYAAVNTANNLAHAVQDAVRAELPQHGFIVRKDFVRRQAAIIDPFANVAARRFEARIRVGQPPRLLLAEFEAGGTREPFTPGAQHVAMPILGRPARPSVRSGVPPAYTFSGLKFRPYRAGQRLRGKGALEAAGSGVHWKGEQRTYIVADVGVFQRIGKELRDTRLIWAFRPPYHFRARLGFVDTARLVVATQGERELQKQVQATLEFHGRAA
jgi:hypothetical protein